jgi:hypothetical protein
MSSLLASRPSYETFQPARIHYNLCLIGRNEAYTKCLLFPKIFLLISDILR